MKKIGIISAAILAMMCSTASAQYYDEYGNWRETRYTNSVNSYSSEFEDGWGTFYAGYAPMQLTTTVHDGENRLYHTATVGFTYNFQLGYSPVFLAPAWEASGAWFSERYKDGTKYSMNLYYSKIPVNLAFRFDVAPEFAIVPFGGVYVKWNIYAEEREKDIEGYTHKWEIFNDDYMYDDDYNRFQFGYQAGLRLIIGNCISIGAAWTADLTSFCKYYDEYSRREEKEKFQGVSFTLGYVF